MKLLFLFSAIGLMMVAVCLFYVFVGHIFNREGIDKTILTLLLSIMSLMGMIGCIALAN